MKYSVVIMIECDTYVQAEETALKYAHQIENIQGEFIGETRTVKNWKVNGKRVSIALREQRKGGKP